MALTQDPANLITDPLALRFMTGEQMGYMPEAQYLTPSEYGAFRTLPGPQGHNYLNQDPGFLQSLLIRSRGSLGFLPTYTFNTYNPAVNLQQYMYHMRTRSDDSLMAGVGVGADMAASMGVGMLLGGVPGLAAGMLMPDISKPMLDRIRDMRGIQNMSMSKIVGGADVNQVTGAGFNAASARSLDSFLRTSSAGDALLKQGDWRKLLQLGIEHGQFDYAGNADQYKDALKKLRKSITTVMEVAGSTDFKDIMKEYKRMRTMGADLSEYTNIMRKEDMYSRVTGLSHADMVNTYGQQGALIYQQAGLTGYQGSLQAMHNAASITLMQRTGLLSPGALSRYGGISGLAQAMTQQDATAQNRIADFMLPYFMKEDASGLDNSATLRDVLNSSDPLGMLGRAAGRKTRTLEQKMRFDHNRGDLMQKLQERYGQENITAVLALQTGHQVRLKGLEAMEYGYRQLGYDPNIAHLKARNFASSDFREQEERELQLARRKLREERDLAESPFRKLALSLDKTFTRWGENIFGGLTDWYAGWTERRTQHAEDQYDTGANMHLSPDQQKAQQRSAYGEEHGGIIPEPPQGPTAHPVTDLATLAEPAAQVFSGNNSGKVSWNEKDGTRYGLFGWSADQMKEFGNWIKERGPKGAYWAEEFEKAGGFKNFGSLDEAQKSEISQLLTRLSEDEDFAKKQREYVYEKFYQPSVAAMEPGKRAEMMATKAGQQLLFMEAAQGAKITRTPSGKVYPAGTKIGDIIAPYESGTEGIFNVDYDSGGGTSYGKWQLSSKQGSYQEWLEDMEAEGGEAAQIAKRLRDVGGFDTGSRTGAQVDAYKREAARNPELIERTQHASIMKRKYGSAFKLIQSESLRKMIESDRAIQEMLYSTAVQHGEGGAGKIFNTVYREGMTREDLIRAVYTRRGEVFPTTKPRYEEEVQTVLGIGETPYSGSQGDLTAAMSAKIADITQYAISKGVRYHMNKEGEKGPRSIAEGATDCSGWIMETGAKMMEDINREAGAEVFTEKDKQDLKTAYTAANIIEVFSKKTGGRLLDRSQLAPGRARAGMYIGMDTGYKGWDKGRFNGIDHIVQTYIDPNTGELMVSQSSSKGGGVNRISYRQWYNELGSKTKLYGVDMTSIADARKVRPGQGGGIPGMRIDVKSTAADIFEESMKAGNGKITPDVITAVIDRHRKQAAGNKDQLAALDEVERRLRATFNVDETRKAADEAKQNASRDMRNRWDEELKDVYQHVNGEIFAAFESAHSAWGIAPNAEKGDIRHLEQVLGRYQSGVDVNSGGVVDYEGLANLLSKTIGRKEDGSLKFDKSAFKAEVVRHNTEGALAGADSEEKAISHVRKILESSNLNLSKEDIEKASKDEVFRSAVLSAGIHALSPENAQEIVTSFTHKAEKAELKRHEGELKELENIYLKHTNEAFEISLPGINDLGKEYKAAREAIKARAFKGEESTPFIINVARLSMLKKLSGNPHVGSYYKEQFRIEAKRNGFDDAWVDKQLESINDITHGDLKGNDYFKSITEEDMRNVNVISEALSRELGNTPAKSKDVIDKYEANLARENSPLTRQQSTLLAARNKADANQLARRLGMKPEDLLTAPGIAKAHRMLVEGRIGAKEDIDIVKAAWEKHQKGQRLTYSDFIPIRDTRLNNSDEFTWSARNQDRSAAEVSRGVQREER